MCSYLFQVKKRPLREMLLGLWGAQAPSLSGLGLDCDEEVFFRAREQPLEKPLVGLLWAAYELVLPLTQPLDVEFLTG